ncbi:bacteriohemerythrin [Reichenbachiella ulvae]|uniref:Bacteriohemerythrin n=1 Tax=Reichenbachiella ulvae TaxID=2980104 RepID=A0ABT3CTY3_9BACT|nr:bacteriohemerythrin [Reichenbachiella ulvae]MCV9387052.1 bacteriohemerythrin [Reichenbachiella ulvae]
MITWKEDYNTGVQEIDEQHQDLFDYINQLDQCIRDEEYEGARIEIILNFLQMFCATHFCLEEVCMRQRACPVQEKNKKAHDKFLSFYSEFQDKYRTTNNKELLIRKLREALETWLVNHILKIDMHIKKCNNVNKAVY